MPGAGLSVSLTLTYDKRPSDFGLAHKRSHTMTTCTAETQCMTPFNLFFDRKRSSACPHVELPSPIISYSPVRSQMSSWNRGHPEKHNSTNMRDKRERWEASRTRQDLSRDDLLFLLSILEGELQVRMIWSHPACCRSVAESPAFYCNVFNTQARDEVIAVLKSERTDSALLGAQYGFSGPEKPLRALQRDSLRAQQYQLQDVYKNPTAQVPRANSENVDTIWSRLLKFNEVTALRSDIYYHYVIGQICHFALQVIFSSAMNTNL